jgi:hypothetical protein
MECPEEMFLEVQLMTIEYSPLRSGFSKWRSFKYKSEKIPESDINLQEISGEKYFLLYFKTRNIIQGILYSSIEKRISIKQSQAYFLSVKRLWDMINPFHLRGISKKVYTRLLVFLYFNYMNLTTDLPQSEELAEEDCDTDFAGEVCLSFVDFYNGLFECVDYFTKSYLVSEYSRFVNTLQEKMKGCFWFNGLDLHNKLHVDNYKQQYQPWMLQHLKVTQKRQQSLNSPLHIRVSQRLLTKPEHIIDKSENKILEKRINKLSRMQSVPIKYIVLNRTAQSQEKVRRQRPLTRGKPQQKKILRFRRNSNLLEDVIEKRKPQYFNKTQEIFFSLYQTI